MLRFYKILIFIAGLMLLTMGAKAEETYKPGYEIIIDDLDSGSGFSCTNGFIKMSSTDAYHGEAHLATTTETNAQKARWTPNIPVSGCYRVYITYPEISNAAKTANIQITYGRNKTVYNAREINQRYNAGKWVYLGTYFMPAGTTSNVALKPDADGTVVADAVKFVLSAANEPVEAEMNKVFSAVAYHENEAVLVQDMESGADYVAIKGEPFYIKGVCKSDGMEDIHQAGANTFRTYSAMISGGAAQAALDKAEKLGMKVVLGLDMPKETERFTYDENYDDFINGALINLKKQIDQFKDHPALLMWAVGNEVDVINCSSAVYTAINKVAGYIKAVDPYHPITTVHAGAAASKIIAVKQYAPCIDVVSTNIYSGIENAYKNIISDAAWQGPYMITEYSINQPSEELKLKKGINWIFDDTVIEKTDTEKGQEYYDRYMKYIYANKSRCLGSFAFAACDTYRGTHTWYNIFLEEDLKKTPVYDALYYAWNGKKRTNTAPTVQAILIDYKKGTQSIMLEKGKSAVVDIGVFDENNDALTYKFEVRRDSINMFTEPISGVAFEADSEKSSRINVSNLPNDDGVYRLFVYVYDGNGNIGYGNVPFMITTGGGEALKLAKEDFLGISRLSSLYTTPESNGFRRTWKTSSALAVASSMEIVRLGDDYLAAATPNPITKNLYNELTVPIDMDSDTDYYASWIQGYTSLEKGAYVKVGFVNAATNQEISTVFLWDTMPKVGIKAGTGISYSSNFVNSGSLYHVICRIRAKAAGDDIVSIKVWPVNYNQPYDWTHIYQKEITGEFSLVAFMTNSANGSRGYFGNFSLESFTGCAQKRMCSAYDIVKNYLTSTMPMPTFTDFSGFSSYDFMQEILKNKSDVYIKEIKLYHGNARVSNIPEKAEMMQVHLTLSNDNGSVEEPVNNIYICCYNETGELLSFNVISGQSGRCAAMSEKTFIFDVPEGTETITVCCWNKDMQPITRKTQITRTGITNY